MTENWISLQGLSITFLYCLITIPVMLHLTIILVRKTRKEDKSYGAVSSQISAAFRLICTAITSFIACVLFISSYLPGTLSGLKTDNDPATYQGVYDGSDILLAYIYYEAFGYSLAGAIVSVPFLLNAANRDELLIIFGCMHRDHDELVYEHPIPSSRRGSPGTLVTDLESSTDILQQPNT